MFKWTGIFRNNNFNQDKQFKAWRVGEDFFTPKSEAYLQSTVAFQINFSSCPNFPIPIPLLPICVGMLVCEQLFVLNCLKLPQANNNNIMLISAKKWELSCWVNSNFIPEYKSPLFVYLIIKDVWMLAFHTNEYAYYS